VANWTRIHEALLEAYKSGASHSPSDADHRVGVNAAKALAEKFGIDELLEALEHTMEFWRHDTAVHARSLVARRLRAAYERYVSVVSPEGTRASDTGTKGDWHDDIPKTDEAGAGDSQSSA